VTSPTRAAEPIDERPADLAPRLLGWFDRHGRKTLPWQHHPDAYRVWISEVMLQQTQVRAVIPYYERFLARFPDVRTLAAAELDEVLHLWSGLGYYARARSLHRAARLVCVQHGGELPRDPKALARLPGIGRSTAGAILALAYGSRHAILDGNAKRVLARVHAVPGWPGRSEVARELWRLAERQTPETRVADYTQAIMDLGATVCTRSRPRCDVCPLAGGCLAQLHGEQALYPAPRPKRARPRRRTVFLIARNGRGEVLLERRPPTGVWGGLFCFPEGDPGCDPRAWAGERLGTNTARVTPLATVRHGFTHFDLDIEPVLVELDGRPEAGAAVMEGGGSLWYKWGSSEAIGLAAPVAELLARIERLSSEEAPPSERNR